MLRHDDEHRGPAVQDAIPLNECYWQLIELVDHTQLLQKVAEREHEKLFSEIYPAEQLDAAMLEHRKNAVAQDTLTMAIRFGDLQLWVRPIGEGDTPVANSAILELTHDTIATGVYIPMNDDGWLRGRPLFIKKADWATFITDLPRREGPDSEKPATAGRPNKRNEAIAVYNRRFEQGERLPSAKAEAKAVWEILAKSHDNDPSWRYKLASVEKALSDHRRMAAKGSHI